MEPEDIIEALTDEQKTQAILALFKWLLDLYQPEDSILDCIQEGRY